MIEITSPIIGGGFFLLVMGRGDRYVVPLYLKEESEKKYLYFCPWSNFSQKRSKGLLPCFF
jgi:hypothetical protein